MKILGIGNAIVDVLCKVSDEFLIKNSLAKSTMKLVNELEFKTLLSSLEIEETISGGSVANSIVGLSQLGNRVGFLGKINSDELGKKYEEGLINENVQFLYKKKMYIETKMDQNQIIRNLLSLNDKVNKLSIREFPQTVSNVDESQKVLELTEKLETANKLILKLEESIQNNYKENQEQLKKLNSVILSLENKLKQIPNVEDMLSQDSFKLSVEQLRAEISQINSVDIEVLKKNYNDISKKLEKSVDKATVTKMINQAINKN